MSQPYFIGQEIDLIATITSVNEANSVAITVRSPNGTITTPAVTLSAVDQGGLWVTTATAQVLLNASGMWQWEAVSSGQVIAANPTGLFKVAANPF